MYDTKTGVIYYEEWTGYRTTVSLCSWTVFSLGVDENRVKWMPTHDNYVAFKPVLCMFFYFYGKIFLFEFFFRIIKILIENLVITQRWDTSMDGPATITTFGGDTDSQTAEKLKTIEKG